MAGQRRACHALEEVGISCWRGDGSLDAIL
jgi:hypothetical protein